MQRSIEADLAGERKRVYRYVERHAPVSPSTVTEAMDVGAGDLGQHLVALQHQGLLAVDERNATMFAPVHPGQAETYTDDGVTYCVRPAHQGDFAGVVGVVHEVASQSGYVTAERFAAQLEYEETLFRRTPTHSRVLFVATVEDDVVGWTHLVAPELPSLSSAIELTLGVVAEYRGCGIGTRLLDRGIEWARTRGCTKLYNSLPATNESAIEFLEAYGCEVEAVRPDHYEIDGDLVDEVQVAYRLD